jgi:hypothetical protein
LCTPLHKRACDGFAPQAKPNPPRFRNANGPPQGRPFRDEGEALRTRATRWSYFAVIFRALAASLPGAWQYHVVEPAAVGVWS